MGNAKKSVLSLEQLRPGTPTFGSGTFPSVVRPVRTHPDPILSTVATEIDPCEPAMVALGRVLVATMRASPACVGIAAPQIGESVRIICVDVTGHRKARSCAGELLLANPRVVARSGNVVMREGCLSVPHLTGDVARAAEVTVEGFSLGSGRTLRVSADAMEARCLLHEIDHLDGTLFVERVLDPTAHLFARKSYG